MVVLVFLLNVIVNFITNVAIRSFIWLVVPEAHILIRKVSEGWVSLIVQILEKRGRETGSNV